MIIDKSPNDSKKINVKKEVIRGQESPQAVLLLLLFAL